jgi:hypothetical protein
MLRTDYKSDVAVPRLFEFGEGDRTITEGRIREYGTIPGHAPEYHEVIVAFEIDGYDERRQLV